MGLLEYLSVSKGPFFTFKDHFGKEHTMRAKTIHNYIMEQSQESDYEWIAPALELVKICKDERFPREYAVDIEMAILTCFANIEARVNRGGDKRVTKANDALAVQYCYDELGRLMSSTDDKKFKKTLNSVRKRYLLEMISSAVNTTTRGQYWRCKAFRDLKEEVIAKSFAKYSMLEENFNILDMYEEISEETESIFNEADKNGMFRAEEREAMLNIARIFESACEHPDADVRAMFAKTNATFKGDHKKQGGQEAPQSSSEEDVLSK